MAYTLDFVTNCEGFFYCWAVWLNNNTNGFAFTAFLIAFAAFLFLASQKFGTVRAYAFASIAAMLASLFLVTINLVTWWVTTIFIFNGLFAFIALINMEKG